MPEQRRGLSSRAASAITNHPFLTLFLGILMFFAVMPGGQWITTNFTHTSFFRAGDPLLERLQAFERRFGSDDTVILVVHSESGIFDVETAGLVQELTEEMWQLPEVIRVDTLANYQWVHSVDGDLIVEPMLPEELDQAVLDERREISLAHPSLPDFLVSRDGNTTLAYAKLRPTIEGPIPPEEVTLAARELAERFQRGDHTLYVTGGPPVTHGFEELANSDMERLMPVVLGITIVFLIGSFRTIAGVVLPLGLMFCSILVSMAVSGWVGLEINSITSMLPQILIALSIANSVHVLHSYYQGRRSGMERKEAARYTIEKNLVPTGVTSLTTAVGFYSFGTAKLLPVLGLGVLAGTGTLITWTFTFLLMAPLLSVLPLRVPLGSKGERPIDEPRPIMARYARWLARRRRPVLFGGVFFALACAALGAGIRVNADPVAYFTESYGVRQAQEFLIEHAGGFIAFELEVDSGEPEGIKDPDFLRRVRAFERQVGELPGVTRTVSLVETIEQTHSALHDDDPAFRVIPDTSQLVAQELFLYSMNLPQGMDLNDRMTVENDALRVSVVATIRDSATHTATARRIEAIGAEHGLDVTVTGKLDLYQSMNDYVVQSFVVSLLIAVLLISVLMAVFMRSPRIGLLSMVPNVLPLMIGAAALRLIGHDLDVGTVMVASVCLGVAVDDTIHVIANFRRYLEKGKSAVEATALVLSHTGGALMLTTAVLVCAFGAFRFASFQPNVYFGMLTAIVLSVALFADLTVLPALLLEVFGDKEEEQASPGAQPAERVA